MIRMASVLAIFFCASSALAAIPPLKVNPLGNPDAPVKGTFYNNLHSEPEDLSPYSHEYVSRLAYEYTHEGLLRVNPETYEFEPELAERYEVSKDFLTYTFFLNKKATWFDGKPVTAEDVKFSVESVRDPAFGAAHRIPYYEDIQSIEVVDPHTIRFKMKKKYFKNLEVLASEGHTPIVPKHKYQDPKAKHPVSKLYGSGPYMVEAYNRGKNLILVRNPNYWGKDEPGLKSMGKFERINFRFIKEENLQIEMVRKGQIDYMWPIQIENFEKKAVGGPFGTTVRKVQAENRKPKRYGFVGWNLKKPWFKDRDTRIALSHLFNRKLLIEKFMFDKAVEGIGPVYYKSPFMPTDLKPIEFDPAKAKALLTKAGWADKDKNGILEKTVDGKPLEFRFDLLIPTRDAEKYFTIYKEDLKKAGIEMNVKLIEWNTFSKLLDEQKFDAVTLAWAGGAPEDDLKQLWHSDSARLGGSNFVGYTNKEVDKYIDQAREEMDKAKRTKLWQKAVRQIVADAPYTYLFNLKYDLYLLNDRIGFDKNTYTYDFSTHYWYLSK